MRLLYALAVFVPLALAAPATELQARAPAASVYNTLFCTDTNFGGSCIYIPVVPGQCYDFNSGFTFLYKQVSSTWIPDGIVCIFYEEFECVSQGYAGSDEVALQAGTYSDFTQIQGIWGSPSFNDVIASFSCSAL